MDSAFFERPILNSPYECPARYWEHPAADRLRRCGGAARHWKAAVRPDSIINDLRRRIDLWRKLPSPSQWQVTPETARLLQHWRHHRFASIRPFFCQVEAVETVAKVEKKFAEMIDRLPKETA